MSPYTSSREGASIRAPPASRRVRKGATESGRRRHYDGNDKVDMGNFDVNDGNCSESSSGAIRSSRKSPAGIGSTSRGSHEDRKSRRHCDEPYERYRRSGKDRDSRRPSVEAAPPPGRHRTSGRHRGDKTDYADEAGNESSSYAETERHRSKDRRSYRADESERRRISRHRASDDRATQDSTEDSHPGGDTRGANGYDNNRGRPSAYSRRSAKHQYEDTKFSGSSGSSHGSDQEAGHSRRSRHTRSHRGINSSVKNSPRSRNSCVHDDGTTGSSRRSGNFRDDDDHFDCSRTRKPGLSRRHDGSDWDNGAVGITDRRSGDWDNGAGGNCYGRRSDAESDSIGQGIHGWLNEYRGGSGYGGADDNRNNRYPAGGSRGSYRGRGSGHRGGYSDPPRGGGYSDARRGGGYFDGTRGGGFSDHRRGSTSYANDTRSSGYGRDGYKGDRDAYGEHGGADVPSPAAKKDMSELLSQLQAITLDTSIGRPVNFIRNFYMEHPAVEGMTTEEAARERESREISFFYPDDIRLAPKPVLTFEQSSFPDPITLMLSNKFSAPTAVQVQGWPVALSGNDMIAIAETGSGKTLAYVLPGLVHIHAQPALSRRDGPIMLILAPTRELAEQIGVETKPFADLLKQRVATFFGQMDISMLQSGIQAIESGVHIVVACPGKLMDLFRKRSIQFNRVTYFVLDEADRLLDMGFKPQISAINGLIYPDRQILMWSATWPDEVRSLADDLFSGSDPPFHFQVGAGKKVVRSVKQQFVNCQGCNKEREFVRVMTENASRLTLVFCNMKKTVDWLAARLSHTTRNSIFPVTIHGGLDGHTRRSNLEMFRRKQKNCLIATELASRGLDIPNIQVVVNYDCPESLDNYIHRVGRTGRVGKPGESITLIDNGDEFRCKDFFRGIIPNLLANDQHVPSWLQQKAAALVGGGGLITSGATSWDSWTGATASTVATGDPSGLATDCGADLSGMVEDEWGGHGFS